MNQRAEARVPGFVGTSQHVNCADWVIGQAGRDVQGVGRRH